MGIFDRKELNESQQRLIDLARLDAEQLLDRANMVKNGRYKSLFTTHLEEAMMFLNKAIAHDGITE